MLDAQEEYHNKSQVYRVKHDDRCKALLVTCEHFTKEPVEAICPCAISFCNFHTTIYLGPLNDMDIWRAYIGNACNLKALAGEKTLIVARQELKELCHTLVTYYKTSNGFDSSGERQHDCLFDVFLDMDLSPSKAIPNVWMKKAPREKSSEVSATTLHSRMMDLLSTASDVFIHQSRRCSRQTLEILHMIDDVQDLLLPLDWKQSQERQRKITILTRRIVGSGRILTNN